MGQKATQRQRLISVDGIPDYWATIKGGGPKAKGELAWNGGDLIAEALGAASEFENVVVSRPYDPVRDGAIIRQLVPINGQWRTTVTDQDTDPYLVPLGTPRVYPAALLLEVTVPEGDAASGDGSMLELTFMVTNLV